MVFWDTVAPFGAGLVVLFRLGGYLVVRGALSAEAVDECNAALYRQWARGTRRPADLARGAAALTGDEGRFEMTGMLGWSEPEREPFRKLLVHPVVVSRLNAFCGRGFRPRPRTLADRGEQGHRRPPVARGG